MPRAASFSSVPSRSRIPKHTWSGRFRRTATLHSRLARRLAGSDLRTWHRLWADDEQSGSNSSVSPISSFPTIVRISNLTLRRRYPSALDSKLRNIVPGAFTPVLAKDFVRLVADIR
jgi:hypothetical protein